MSDPVFPADLVLTTERLTIRPLDDGDLDALVVAASDPLTQRWIPLPRPYLIEHARGFVHDIATAAQTSGGGLVRGIECEGELAGAIDFKRTDWINGETEMGYWTHPAFRGRGIVPEAAAALARYALTALGLQRVVVRVATGNTGSARAAEKAGFIREGVARNAGYVHDGRVDLVVFSMIRSDLPG